VLTSRRDPLRSDSRGIMAVSSSAWEGLRWRPELPPPRPGFPMTTTGPTPPSRSSSRKFPKCARRGPQLFVSRANCRPWWLPLRNEVPEIQGGFGADRGPMAPGRPIHRPASVGPRQPRWLRRHEREWIPVVPARWPAAPAYPAGGPTNFAAKKIDVIRWSLPIHGQYLANSTEPARVEIAAGGPRRATTRHVLCHLTNSGLAIAAKVQERAPSRPPAPAGRFDDQKIPGITDRLPRCQKPLN